MSEKKTALQRFSECTEMTPSLRNVAPQESSALYGRLRGELHPQNGESMNMIS